jgi:hypothetical protein
MGLMGVARANTLVGVSPEPFLLLLLLVQEVQSEEDTPDPKWSQNANLGRFTNFVNLLDM